MRSQPGFRKGAWLARDLIVSSDLSGQAVLLHLPSGIYFGLEGSAAQIVSLLNEEKGHWAAAEELARRTGISAERAMADVGAVIDAVQGLESPRIDRGRRPTVTGALFAVRSWRRLPWRHRIATAQAASIVALVEAGLYFTSLTRVASLLGVPLSTDQVAVPVPAPDNLGSLSEKEQRAHWAVQWVLRQWLFDGTCLRWSLAFGWFIRRRNPVLRLGLIDEEGTTAHAWVEAGEHAFNTTAVAGPFVSSFH
jgi:hypothetical protein